MRRTLFALALAASPIFCHGQAPAVLGKCIVENLSQQDRADLARWVFLSMAVHPRVAQFSNVPAESREQTPRAVGLLFTRLMSDACSKELRDAGKPGGPPVIPAAIQFLTQIGVQELMTDRDVLATLHSFSRFADKEAIEHAQQRR